MIYLKPLSFFKVFEVVYKIKPYNQLKIKWENREREKPDVYKLCDIKIFYPC